MSDSTTAAIANAIASAIAGDAVTVAGILLAAGGSSRLGSPKQLLKMNGVTLVEHAARQLLDAGCSPVLVVIGANAGKIRDAVAMLPVECVENAHWERGMGTSIASAIHVLNDVRFAHTSAVLIATCDMPTVTVEHLQSLLATSNRGAQPTATAGACIQSRPAQPSASARESLLVCCFHLSPSPLFSLLSPLPPSVALSSFF